MIESPHSIQPPKRCSPVVTYLHAARLGGPLRSGCACSTQPSIVHTMKQPQLDTLLETQLCTGSCCCTGCLHIANVSFVRAEWWSGGVKRPVMQQWPWQEMPIIFQECQPVCTDTHSTLLYHQRLTYADRTCGM
jgi:hypothetical protein